MMKQTKIRPALANPLFLLATAFLAGTLAFALAAIVTSL
jgi:hypothetical protein